MFKKLKSLFIIEEEGSKETTPGDGPDQEAHEPAPKEESPAYILDDVPQSTSGKVDDKFLSVLLQALQDNNQEGFDYLEFKEFLRALDAMEMDEQTKFRSAYANASTMGASVQLLDSSARQYLDVLKKEEQKFDAAVKSQRAKIVEHRQKEVEKLEGLIDKKRQQIEQLKSDIDQHKLQMTEEQKAISEARAKIEHTKNNFLFTYNTLVKQIKSDLENINQHLK